MMEVQWHLQYLENIVIPPHLAKYPQATNSLFIFILIIQTLELDSNWNTMQQVRIHTEQILVHFSPIHLVQDLESLTLFFFTFEKNYQWFSDLVFRKISLCTRSDHYFFFALLTRITTTKSSPEPNGQGFCVQSSEKWHTN